MSLLKTSKIRVALTVIIGGAVLCAGLVLSSDPKPLSHNSSVLSSGATPQKQEILEEEKVGLPVRLKIPKINVDAGLENVGVTSAGALDVPKSPTSGGWYSAGPRPGEKGNSVIDGHFGYKDRIPAIFDNLSRLSKGDKVYVTDAGGKTITFVVRELKTYDRKADATGIFSSSDERAHLNLITCQGDWDNNQSTYSERLVVFTDKENK